MTYALITGASKGIGKAVAEELARRKFNVLLIARTEPLLQQITQAITKEHAVQADCLALDLAAPDAAERIYNWCSEKKYDISVLVNNAGYGLSGPLDMYSAEETSDMMHVNMTAMVQLCRLFIPQMKNLPKAYILNMGSAAAYQAVPYLTVYAASKSFVLQFSRGLKHELSNTPISVTCICPGSVDTEFPQRAQVKEKVIRMAKKVHVSPEIIAKAAVKGMLAGKTEVVVGFLNKLGVFLAWLLPKSWSEKAARNIYK